MCGLNYFMRKLKILTLYLLVILKEVCKFFNVPAFKIQNLFLVFFIVWARCSILLLLIGSYGRSECFCLVLFQSICMSLSPCLSLPVSLSPFPSLFPFFPFPFLLPSSFLPFLSLHPISLSLSFLPSLSTPSVSFSLCVFLCISLSLCLFRCLSHSAHPACGKPVTMCEDTQAPHGEAHEYRNRALLPTASTDLHRGECVILEPPVLVKPSDNCIPGGRSLRPWERVWTRLTQLHTTEFLTLRQNHVSNDYISG